MFWNYRHWLYAPSQQMPWTGSYYDYVLSNAQFSCTNVIQTTQPIRADFGGVLAVLGNDPTQAGVRKALNLSSTDGLPEGTIKQNLTSSRVLAAPMSGIDLVISGAIVATEGTIRH